MASQYANIALNRKAIYALIALFMRSDAQDSQRMKVFSADWVRSELKRRDMKVKDLAAAIDADPNKITKSLTGTRRFTANEVIAIKALFERDITEPTLTGSAEKAPHGSSLVRVYDIQAAAGNGFIPDSYEAVVDLLAFPQRYLSDITKTSPEHLAIIGVVGSSMQPTLNHGDVVMVDMTKTDIDFDGMFVVRIGEALKVKRVSYGAKRRSIIVRSDNPNKLQFPDEEYFQGDDIQVVGRVAWIGAKQP